MSRYKRRRLTDTREATFTEIDPIDHLGLEDENSVKDAKIFHSEQTKSLFVHSLPSTATTESLTKFFSQSCPLKHATIVADPKTKACKGYGFVTFADTGDAKDAMETYNGSVFEGKKIRVEAAEPRRRGLNEDGGTREKRPHAALLAPVSKPVQVRRQSDNQGPPKLIVRNLPWSIKEPEQLSALFTSYAKVKHAILPKKHPHLSAGFGFVVLQRRKDGDHALQSVNGKEVEGRKLAVDWAVEKSVWDALHKEQGRNLQTQILKDSITCEASPKIQSEADDDNSTANQFITDDADDAGDAGDAHVSDIDSHGESDYELHKGLDHGEDRIRQTLFVQNIPFTVTEDVLREHFHSFGSLRYARIVLDTVTERSKGVGFVCFYSQENTDACLRGAPRSHLMNINKAADGASGTAPGTRSLLESYLADPTGRYTLEGRVLHVSRAIQKGEAERLTVANRTLRDLQDKDKRRLYLLSEGNIPSNSPLYNQLVASEIKMREDSARQRHNLIKGNPSLHLSLTRLSIRNLPHNITSKTLKALARKAVVGFATEVKAGIRQPISKEEVSRGGHILKEAEKAYKAKGKGIVKQAKVIFEGREGQKVTETSGAGRSRGYGFIEYTSHRWALMGLRWLNGRGVTDILQQDQGLDITREEFKDKKKRLIVEFAIENSQVTGRRQEREIKARERSQIGSEKRESEGVRGTRSKTLSKNQEMAKMRKKGQDTEGSRNMSNIKPTPKILHGKEDQSGTLDDSSKLARRQRIIGKKRMIRKHRKST